jgi:hypothetical protein
MKAESAIIGGGKIGRMDYDIDDSGCIVPADIVANQSLPEANCEGVGGRVNPDSCLFYASRKSDEARPSKRNGSNCSTAVLVNELTTCLDAIQDHQSPHKSLANESMVTSEARDTPTLSLRSKVNEATNLNGTERQQLFSTLVKYEKHFSEKPGKCNLFKYKFDVETTELLVSRSRPLPFAVRKEVRQQKKTAVT